jgi:predicted DNA-binding transcriptional regulator YafY
MNRTDRLYALVEELRAAGPRGRSARRLAERFEVSIRTIERDLSALGQAGVPISAQPGRLGGYLLDRSMSLPPLNFTPDEAAAVAVALSRAEQAPLARAARSALRKIVAAMPEAAARQARELTDGVRLLVQPTPTPDPEVVDAVWRAVHDRRVLCLDYIDVGGERTLREVEPHHMVLGPNGSYLTGWCRLREDDRVFRMDRIRSAQPVPGPAALTRPAREPDVPDLVTRVPVWE